MHRTELSRLPAILVGTPMPIRFTLTMIVWVLVFAGTPRSANAQLPSLGLRALSQTFFRPGASYEVDVRDSIDGQEIDRLHFSDQGIKSALVRPATESPADTSVTEPSYGKFNVALDKAVADGCYQSRISGRFGESNPRGVVVDERVVWVDQFPNSAAQPLPVELNQIYAGRVPATTRSYAVFKTVAGQTYRLRLISHAVDSKLIGSVTVYDREGQVLANRFGGLDVDTELTFGTDADDLVTIKFGDALYRGGDLFSCGLLITDQSMSSWIDDFHHRQVNSIGITPLMDRPVSTVSTEPYQVPFVVDGAFNSSDELDSHLAYFPKGTPLTVDVISERIGQPTDVRVTIYQQTAPEGQAPVWKPIANADDRANVGDAVVRLISKDPQLRFVPPTDGVYKIVVFDQDNGQALGSEQRYRLIVQNEQDDFELLAYSVTPSKDLNFARPQGIYLPRGGAQTIRVFALRTGKNVPIRLTVRDLPEGIHCQPAWIASNQSTADLILTADVSANALTTSLNIEGWCEVAGQTLSKPARLATIATDADSHQPQPTFRQCDQLSITVGELDQCPVSIKASEPSTLTIPKGGKGQAILKIVRGEGNQSSIILRAKGLPPGVKVADLAIAGDKDEGTWPIEVTDKATPGTYTFWGQAETKVKFATNPQALDRVKAKHQKLKQMLESATEATRAGLQKQVEDSEKQVQAVAKQVAAKDVALYAPSSLITVVVE
ncbi:hypothetical protein [Roseiconus lacunae]|uniref:Uncharacterized protein n=1 Tax=Roseiconus lacunae TaxID=2605694 RepID=A0ABT7PL03_9BACT|nr:hypothetical protein [Roseiconus lacunae]MDM4017187.1 hypothetical protein [Roseiconus lacunae]